MSVIASRRTPWHVVSGKRKLQRGLSLIEASMVLALSAIVVSGVMYYYQAASDNNKTQNTVSEVMSVVSAVNGLFVGQQNFNDLSTEIVAKTSSVPDNYKRTEGGKTTIANPFGGTVDLQKSKSEGNRYQLILDQIPDNACTYLATMNFGTSMVGAGVFGSADNAKSAAAPTSTTGGDNSYKQGALTPAEASAACDNNNNVVAFYMK